ncbi:hypothetical protein [Streptomyces botrytidirepellens]|uniref:Uncharacterized protein n=1 Tax=Streptomyces botrytidirepellens TaxID=2486417 RepID=A0A3M8V5P6_9ACTN|nr:hypothetical protein [Streptomyces botrytidirepellens]RNG12429.1 hypothetical protein EEJ42_32235 [Streptomyces botrytidirepellens]
MTSRSGAPCAGCTVFDFDPNHNPNHYDGISMGPAWLCTGCKWGIYSASRSPKPGTRTAT